jgi:hypothetical protein
VQAKKEEYDEKEVRVLHSATLSDSHANKLRAIEFYHPHRIARRRDAHTGDYAVAHTSLSSNQPT